jgi:hypothetical protein
VKESEWNDEGNKGHQTNLQSSEGKKSNALFEQSSWYLEEKASKFVVFWFEIAEDWSFEIGWGWFDWNSSGNVEMIDEYFSQKLHSSVGDHRWRKRDNAGDVSRRLVHGIETKHFGNSSKDLFWQLSLKSDILQKQIRL